MPLKILIVDDEIASVEFLSAVLEKHGFENIHALSDSRDVLSYVQQNEPDLILLDLLMPHFDGFEILRQLRGVLPANEYLPILVITSDDDQRTHQQAMREGATDFLTKPLKTIEVVLRVCNLLRARWQHLQLQEEARRLEAETATQRHLAEELGEATARLSALVENLQSGVLVEDENRRIVLCNPRFCDLFQIPAPPEALKGADCSQAAEESKQFFAHPDAFVQRLDEILQRREIVTSEELILADGRTLERDYVPIFRNETYRGHLWAYRDISERKRHEETLRQSEARKSATLQTAMDGIVTIDADGKILEWNRAAEQIFGHSNAEAIGNMVDIIVAPGLHKAHHAGLHRQATTGEIRILGQRVEVPALHKDGHEFPIEIAVARIDTPNGPQYTGFLRDISERKRFEMELAQARDVALESARLKASFLANMSHEIRTPINGVIGMLELLAETSLSTDQGALLQTARTSADALLDIINDILDFSKIEAGKLTIEESIFAPRDLIEECIVMVAGAAHDKVLDVISHIEDDVPTLLIGDGLRLRQILTNFLSNAVKFTSQGEIVVRVRREIPLTLHFSVTDSGEGIAPEVAQKLFQPFIQADGSTTRRFGGTGLGLAISKQLVELMNGEIGLESTLGKGSTFWFSIPLRLAPQEELKLYKERIVPDNLSKAHILVVEDNNTTRELLQAQLTSWNIKNAGAQGVQDALNQLQSAAQIQSPFDVVLLDAQLPNDESQVLAVQVGINESLHNPHLLLMSSFHANAGPATLVSKGLTKPVRPSLLFDALVSLFNDSDSTPRRTIVTKNQRPLPDNTTGRGILILVADDNAINREVALRWLKKWGYSTYPVTNGREAIEVLKTAKFDLVLMDCQMPEMDGYEAATAIRQLPNGAGQVPIIALTAHAMEGDRQKCLDAGMDDYLPKPIRPALLAETVARWQNRTSLSVPVVIQNSIPGEDQILEEETITELQELLGDDDLKVMLEDFIKQGKNYLSDMHGALRQGDAASLAKVVHSLKGAARQLGAVRLALACEILESVAKSADLSNASDSLAKVENAFNISHDEFQKYLIA